MKLEDRDIFKISLKSHHRAILELDSNLGVLVNESMLLSGVNSHTVSLSNIFLLHLVNMYLVILEDSKPLQSRNCSFGSFYFIWLKEEEHQNGVWLFVTGMDDWHDSLHLSYKHLGNPHRVNNFNLNDYSSLKLLMGVISFGVKESNEEERERKRERRKERERTREECLIEHSNHRILL